MVELIPKKQEIKLPRWVDVLFYVAIGFLVSALLIFFIINQLTSATSQDLQETREAIAQARSPERQAMESEILSYKKKIEDFSSLIVTHYQVQKFFAELEKVTHPRVWFSELSLDTQKFTAKLSGQAEGFQTVGQQLSILEADQYLESIELSDMGLLKEGGVQFTLNLSFKPQLFQK